MKQFDIKKGWYGKVEGDLLKNMMESVFGNVTEENGALVSKYGALARIEAKIISKTCMEVDTVNADGKFSDEDILSTKRALNKFLEEATGFDAKARMKREQKKAKSGDL